MSSLVSSDDNAANGSVQVTNAEEVKEPTPGRQQDRLFEGTKKTIQEGKIGGDFKITPNPDFLKQRVAVWDELWAKFLERKAQQVQQSINVNALNINVVPDTAEATQAEDTTGVTDAKNFEVKGTSWQTTPLDVAKEINPKGFMHYIVAAVRYTGERFSMTVDVKDVCFDDLEDEYDMDDDEEENKDGQEEKKTATKAKESAFQLWDMKRPLEGDCEVKFYDWETKEGKTVFWHSSAHVLGEALEEKFGAKLTIGPPLKNGFYYDCYLGDETLADAHRDQVTGMCKKLSKKKQPFERLVMTKDEALRMFADNPFKVAIIKGKVGDNDMTSAYRCGSLIDLCMGPHIPHTGVIKAFKMYKNSSAYWGGNADNDTLQRMYGVAFPTKEALNEWEAFMKIAHENDHRLRGREQDLYFFHKLSPGCCFWEPMGARINLTLQTWIRSEYRKRGYDEVVTPNVFNAKLWKISGHWKHYKDDMFLIKGAKGDGDTIFALKPMNCPSHCLIFDSKVRSYKDLPLRLADFGVLHRNEESGALSGLTRVRRFQQDDGHIYCRADQVKEEVLGALEFMKSVYGIFGMSYKLELSTRPKKASGLETPEGRKLWDDAEEALAEALDEFAGKGKWRVNPGDGAFYGPKIDIKVFDVMKRIHQCATVQLDFQMPRRFNLRYKGPNAPAGAPKGEKKAKKKKEKKKKNKKNKKDQQQQGSSDDKDGGAPGSAGGGCGCHREEEPDDISLEAPLPPGFERPIMIHRAMLGSIERMTAVLTEHFLGKWPFWLSPRQALVIPVHTKDGLDQYAQYVCDKLHDCGFYADVDLSKKTFNKKILLGQKARWNFQLVCGNDEMNNRTVSIRTRNNENKGTMSLDELILYFMKLKTEKSRIDAGNLKQLLKQQEKL